MIKTCTKCGHTGPQSHFNEAKSPTLCNMCAGPVNPPLGPVAFGLGLFTLLMLGLVAYDFLHNKI